MKFISLFSCGKCGEQEIYDTDAQTISCKCGRFYAKFINMQNFRRLPPPGQQELLGEKQHVF